MHRLAGRGTAADLVVFDLDAAPRPVDLGPARTPDPAHLVDVLPEEPGGTAR